MPLLLMDKSIGFIGLFGPARPLTIFFGCRQVSAQQQTAADPQRRLPQHGILAKTVSTCHPIQLSTSSPSFSYRRNVSCGRGPARRRYVTIYGVCVFLSKGIRVVCMQMTFTGMFVHRPAIISRQRILAIISYFNFNFSSSLSSTAGCCFGLRFSRD